MKTPRKFRVAYFCHEYPKYTETFVYREVDRLRRLGMDVLVLAMKRPGKTDAIEGAEEKIKSARYLKPDLSFRLFRAQIMAFLKRPLRYLGLLISILGAEEHRSAASLRVRLGFFLRGALAAWELKAEPDVRLLHCPATGDELIAAHVASRLSGIALSFTLHAPLALFLRDPLLARQARDASLIVAISEDSRRRIIELAGDGIADRVRVIHCGVDLPESAPVCGLGNRRVLSVASLSSYKGHDALIRAMGLLAERGIAATCDIVGEGPERARLERLIKDLGMENRVKLLGGKPPEAVWEILRNSQCFVLASRVDERGARDGIPVALMEAMARSIPCVSTRISGIPELVRDGETGLLVDQENPAALHAAIQKLLDDPDMARRLGEQGREWVKQQFSLDKGARLLAREFQRLAHTLVYVSHEYPKITETFVRREVEALRRAGLRIIVHSFRRPAIAPDSVEASSKDTVYLPGPDSINFYMEAIVFMLRQPLRAARLLWQSARSVGSPGTWRAGWGGVLDVFRGAWIARRLGPEVAGIHGSFAGVAATSAWAAGILTDIPFGFSSHSSPPDPLLAAKCFGASWIFSESDFDRLYISGIAGQSIVEKIHVVRCGLDPEEWPEPDWDSDRYNSGSALFVGTLGPKKGVIPLMEAMIRLGREGVDIKLDVVGDGPLLGEMRSMIQAGGAEGRVCFHGELSFKALLDLYRRARFLVLPAIVTAEGDRDGIPVTLMEAMASGLACVSTPISGIPELVEDSVTGIMAPPGDSVALAGAIKTLRNNPGLCREMGKKGREKVFRNHTASNHMLAFISSLAANKIIPG